MTNQRGCKEIDKKYGKYGLVGNAEEKMKVCCGICDNYCTSGRVGSKGKYYKCKQCDKELVIPIDDGKIYIEDIIVRNILHITYAYSKDFYDSEETAEEMFVKLGFTKMNGGKETEYCTNNTSVSFGDLDKTILIESENGEEFSIDRFNKFSKAINQQCKELRGS